MSASMTLHIVEDDAPDGAVEVSFKVKGFEIENARVNADLPPAVLLGARLLQVIGEEFPSTSVEGRAPNG